MVGKGQFACGAKGCDERRALESYEVSCRCTHAVLVQVAKPYVTSQLFCMGQNLAAFLHLGLRGPSGFIMTLSMFNALMYCLGVRCIMHESST